MKNKYKYLVAGFALILFVLPMIVSSGQLPAPNEPRDCYKWGQTDGMYMCFEPLTGVYAMWFSSYFDMKDYYTPQLKEVDWTVSNMQVIGKKDITINVGYNDGSIGIMKESELGIYTVGNVAYSYVKKT